MKRMARILTILAIISAIIFAGFTYSSFAHNVDQRMAWMFFDQATIDLIKANVDAGKAPVNQNDELGIIIKNLPMPSGATTGVGGYIDFYIPVGTQITDVGYVWPNSGTAGVYDRIPMKGQSVMSLGYGPIGPAITPALVGLTLGPNYLGKTGNAVSAAGTHLGTMAGVYGDTGIFYSADPETAWDTWKNAPGGNYFITNNRGETIFPNNKWDAEQLLAYGSSSTAPIVDPNGRGNSPWGMASGVAGPESGYMWQFDKDVWDASAKTAADMRNSVKPGPWRRIQYPGSMIANDVPGSISTVLGYAGADAGKIGWDIKSSPLPPTTSMSDTTSPKMIRWSVGMLSANHPEYVYIKLKIINEPPLPPFINADGCFDLHGDVFGGDAGGEQGGKDHLWRYYDPTQTFINTCSMFSKDFSAEAALSGTNLQFKLYYWNLGRTDVTNVKIMDTLPSGLVFVSSVPAPSLLSPLTWNIAKVSAGQSYAIDVTVKVSGSGAMITNTATAQNDQGYNVQTSDGFWAGGAPILALSKSVAPSNVAPGGTVKYTVTVRNDGSGPSGNPLKIAEYLPAGFFYVSLDSVINNGANITGLTTVTATNPAQPLFSVAQAVSAGKSLLLTFTAKVGTTVPVGTYTNSFSLTHADPSIGTATLSTGAAAPVTVGGAEISGTIFNDWINADGVQNSPDEGISSFFAPITLQLKDIAGNVIATTTTDANGNYIFPGLVPGTYTVEVVSGVPAGYANTTPINFTVTLTDNQKSSGHNIGYDPGGTGSVGDLVFEDKGNDKTFTAGTDAGIANITVNLYEDTNKNGKIDPEDALVATTSTDGNGNYIFTNLPTGVSYIADVDNTDADLSAYFSPNSFLITNADPQPVSNLSGAYTTADFGFFENLPSSVGNQVFIDSNSNGVYEAGTDMALANVTINFYLDSNGDGLAEPSELVETTSTAGDGTYTFDMLGPGNYIAVLDTSDPEIPGGVIPVTSSYNVTVNPAQNLINIDFPFVEVITKTVDKASANAGDTLNYTVNPYFPGPELLTNATVSDVIPTGTTFFSANADGTYDGVSSVLWNLGTNTANVPGITAGTGTALCPAAGSPLTVTADRDTYLREDQSTNNFGTSTTLISNPAKAGAKKHMLMHFDISAIPVGATIQSATLSLRSKSSRSNHFAQVRNMMTDWTETGANWTKRDGANSWASATAFGSSDYGTNTYATFKANWLKHGIQQARTKAWLWYLLEQIQEMLNGQAVKTEQLQTALFSV